MTAPSDFDAAVERVFRDGFGRVVASLARRFGDLVKAILADALGLHLDQFQRIHVDPASISVVRYTPEAAFVLQTNGTFEVGEYVELEPGAATR